MYGLSALSGGQGMMDNVVQYLMSRSSLEVITVNIRNATKDTFDISLECSVFGTGPVSSTIQPMSVDLLFDGSKFGEMRLPQIQTSMWGTTIMILEQTVQIEDVEAYKAYVRSSIVDELTTFRLDNGDCRIQALGLQVQCGYAMDVSMKGMAGLQAELVEAQRIEADDAVKVALVVEFRNPSPVQIEHGATLFELRTLDGVLLSRLEGWLNIQRGLSRVKLAGVEEAVGIESRDGLSKVRLVGAGAKKADSWCDATIRNVDVILDITERHAVSLDWKR